MKIAKGIFDVIVKIATGFVTEGDEEFIYEQTQQSQGQASSGDLHDTTFEVDGQDVNFEAEEMIEGLSGKLKLTQNPKKILRGVIGRVVDPDYGTRTGKSARHLLQTVLMFKVPMFRRYFAEELQNYVVNQLQPSDELGIPGKTGGHLPSMFSCPQNQVVVLSSASWDLLKDLMIDCLKEASSEDDFKVMGWLIHISGFYAKESGLLMHSIKESLRGNETLQRPELWLRIYDSLAAYEEEFWKGPERSCTKVFGMSLREVTDLALVLRMRSLAGTMRWLGLRLDLVGDDLDCSSQHSQALSSVEDEVEFGSEQPALLADDGGWWGDQFWAGCASKAGEEYLELEDRPLCSSAVAWALGLVAGQRLSQMALCKPPTLSTEELWKGRHCQTVGFCPLLEILRKVVETHSLTGRSPPPDQMISPGEQYLQCICGRKFTEWTVLGCFHDPNPAHSDNNTREIDKTVIGKRLCEHCFRLVCGGWPKGMDHLMPSLFCMGSAVFPPEKPLPPKNVPGFFVTHIEYKEKSRIFSLKEFMEMLKLGIDVAKVEEEKASLFAWAKPKGRTLFLDRRCKRLCWVLKGRQQLAPEQNKFISLKNLKHTEIVQDSGDVQLLLQSTKKNYIIEATDSHSRDLLVAGLDCLMRRFQKTGNLDVSKT